jgi:hypothetical protein
VLYSNEHGLYTQRTDGIITFPDVALDAETDDSIAIRCWVVQETRVNAAPMIVLILDRLLRFNGIPYTLENLAEHDAWLRSFSCRLCSPNPDLAFNVLCRFAASSTLQLWKIAEEVVPHMSMGIRFEQPNMSTCATDRIWIASDPTAHPIEVIADVATGAVKCAITDDNHVSDMIRADARLVTGSDCFTHQKLVAYSNAVQSASYGICQNGDVYTATQAALHAAVTLRH